MQYFGAANIATATAEPCHPCAIFDVMPNRVLRNRVLGMLSGNPYEFQKHTRNPPTIAQAVWGTYCATEKVNGQSCVRK